AAAPAIPAAATDPRRLAGVSASPGVALGKVAQVRRTAISVEEQGAGLERERAHLDAALARARHEISVQRAANSGAASRILDAHLELLADPELIDLAVAGLAGGRSAGFAWREAYSRYAARLEERTRVVCSTRDDVIRCGSGR